MTRKEMSPEEYSRLMDSISRIVFKNGIKSTSMDSIASSLKISKRTLYEIFGSKEVMVTEVLKFNHDKHSQELKRIMENSDNVIDGIIASCEMHRRMILSIHPDFFTDLDSLFADSRKHAEDAKNFFITKSAKILHLGARQGYFRKDINFTLHVRLMWIQAESLKRMEDFFPEDIPFIEAYDALCLSFLRSVATPKGIEYIDSKLPLFTSQPTIL